MDGRVLKNGSIFYQEFIKMSTGGDKLYEFNGFRLDARERTLRRAGEIVPLQPKTIDVLCVLVARAGEVVTKAELMEAVWADAFVEESNLTQSIYTLRKTLGAGVSGEQFIETLARRGYRFAAPVNIVPRMVEPTHVQTRSFFRSWKFAAACIAALLILMPAGIYTAYKYRTKTTTSAAPIENVMPQRLTFSGKVSFPVIAPDGKSFVFAGDEGLFLQDVESGAIVKLEVTGHKVFGNLQFSPDGEHIYFRDEVRPDRGGDLFRIARLGGASQKVADNVWSTPGFSADGKQAAFIRFFPEKSEFHLVVREVASAAENVLLTRHQPQNLLRLIFPAWSPDGQKLLIVEQTAGEKNASRLLVVDVASGIVQMVDTPTFVQVEQPLWHPVTGDIYVAGREQNRFFQLWRITYPAGEIKRITNDLNIYRYISISADGKTMLARQGSSYSHIWTAPAGDLQNPKQLTTGNLNRDGSDGMSWTPGGDIVYSSRITGAIDIWLLRLADGSRKQLTQNAGGANENPFASADGKYIFFDSTRGRARHIWRMGIDGAGPLQMTTGDKERDLWPVVSPDGAWLYYLQRSPNANAIWRKSLADERVEMITDPGKVSPESSLSISADGRYLAFGVSIGKEQGEEGGMLRFGIMPAGEPGRLRLFDLHATIAKIFWEPDSKTFDFIEDTPEGGRIWRQGVEADAKPALLFTAPKDQVFEMTWSADGKTLALSRGRQVNDAILLKNFE
jgi:DNA-binding winged helix-turn-helix (wHTH) protein/Tol biopolymer transport system component